MRCWAPTIRGKGSGKRVGVRLIFRLLKKVMQQCRASASLSNFTALCRKYVVVDTAFAHANANLSSHFGDSEVQYIRLPTEVDAR